MAKVSLPESFDRKSFGLEHPGTFHLAIVAFEEYPTKKNDGSPIAGWRASLHVLAGTESKEVGKDIEVIFNHPVASHKDGGEFCRLLQGRFLYITGVVDASQAGQDIDIDLEKCLPGRQFIAKFAAQTDRDGKERVQLDGANMWHVDDEAVKDIPKDQKQLAKLPKELRLSPAPKQTTKKTEPKKPAAPAPATEYSEPVGAGKVDDSFYDNL